MCIFTQFSIFFSIWNVFAGEEKEELKAFQFNFLKNKNWQMAALCSMNAPATAQDIWES